MTKKTFTVTISDVDEKILKNDISDIQTWLDDAIKGKINQCWKRFRSEWTTKLIDDPVISSIPASKDGLVTEVLSREDYDDRCNRDLKNIQ